MGFDEEAPRELEGYLKEEGWNGGVPSKSVFFASEFKWDRN